MNRRQMLMAIGAGWLADPPRDSPGPIRGRIVGQNHRAGHLLRGALKQEAGPPERAEVVIVGSGMSGLSAAWRLSEMGVSCTMLELERFVGGTSAWGDDGAVPHPWGAHYLPVPEKNARVALRLLDASGLVRGHDAAGRPIFEPRFLCHAPEERLFYGGRWHRGLVPFKALTAEQNQQFERFRQHQEAFKSRKGRDGRPAFALPLMFSSRDPELLALDRISIKRWLEQEGLTDPFIRWYVEYATRDDFGGALEQTSAWAALHYFCARRLDSPQLSGSRFLVWPEGNGWLVKRLIEQANMDRRHGALVTNIRATGNKTVTVDYLDVASKRLRRIEAKGVVAAIPGFILKRIGRSLTIPSQATRQTSAWLVANLHVERPRTNHVVWDSVLYESPSLGYIDASHQLTPPRHRTVLTYYRPFVGGDDAAHRTQLLSRQWNELTSDILLDLATAHPNIASQTERVDIMRWGHAMPRPTPGFLEGAPEANAPMIDARVAWAHVDQSGMALFEEASTRGVAAAEALARAIGKPPAASWL